jgi:CRISPR-associated protein Cas6/Cse3/CasE subtype I-E
MIEFGFTTNIVDLYEQHNQVWRFFGDLSERPFLFRAEETPGSVIGSMVVHVRSSVQPAHVPETMCTEPSWELETGQFYHFDLRAVPMVRAYRKEKYLYGNDAKEWLIRKSGSHGFEVVPDTLWMQSYPTRFNKGNGPTVIADTLFSGTLRVTDPQVFYTVLKTGIGRMKAFGFGMLRCWETS